MINILHSNYIGLVLYQQEQRPHRHFIDIGPGPKSSRGGEGIALDDVSIVAANASLQPAYPLACQQVTGRGEGAARRVFVSRAKCEVARLDFMFFALLR